MRKKRGKCRKKRVRKAINKADSLGETRRRSEKKRRKEIQK